MPFCYSSLNVALGVLSTEEVLSLGTIDYQGWTIACCVYGEISCALQYPTRHQQCLPSSCDNQECLQMLTSVLTLIGGILGHYFFKYFFCSFSLFNIFIKPIFQLVYVSHTCWISCSRFLVFFFFFSLLKVSINIFSNSEILSSVMSSLLMSPPKALFTSFIFFVL